MNNKIVKNFECILKEADDFNFIALHIFNVKQAGGMFYGTQFVVNALFSIELYLKAILTYENKKYLKIHNLKKLFDKISLNRKNKIIKEWEYIVDFLNEQDESFTWWRYHFQYEFLVIANDEILKTMEILKKECDEIKKIVGDMK